tara:strand:+ start:345 stop:545 length:201 start_codon:yes stop_codon:yes gene_type:complete
MAESALNKIKSHEKECALRYTYIEKNLDKIEVRLEEGSLKMARFEKMIWGLYVLTAGLGASKYMGL